MIWVRNTAHSRVALSSYWDQRPAGLALALVVSSFSILLSGVCSTIHAQIAPARYSAYTGTDPKPLPSPPPLGPANSVIVDPTFGSRILRVTDQNTKSGQSFISTDSGFVRAWNADSTAIKLTGPRGDGYWLEFDPATFKVGDGSSRPAVHPVPFGATWEWSTVDPDIIYYLNGSQIAKYNKSTGVATNLGGPSTGDPLGYMAVVVGQDYWVCAAAGPGFQNTRYKIFCLNPISPSINKLIDVYSKTINGVPQGDPNWPTSAPGKFIGIHDIAGGTGASWLEVTFHQQSWGGNGGAVFNLATNTWSLITNADFYWSGHVSMGNGKYANSSGSINGRDSRGMVLRNPDNAMNSAEYRFFYQPPNTSNGWCDADHSSWLNSLTNPDAPILISRYGGGSSCYQQAWTGEINAAAVDGSNTVWRFVHNYNAGFSCYYGQAFAQISNDGKWALFSSYWGGTLGADTAFGCSNRIDTLIVDLMSARPPTTPAGYWKFDEGSGTSALDSSGNGLTGALSNGPVRSAGLSGSALSFDGIDDYVDLGNPAALQLTGPMTAAAWVNTRSLARNGRIVAKSGGTGRLGWSLNVETYNAFEFSIAVDANTYVWLDSVSGVPLNTWVHVVGVYEPGTALRMYINGGLNSSRTGGIPSSQFNPAVNARIGSLADGIFGPCSNCRFDGSIDEVRIYDRALTATEVLQIYSGSGDAVDTTPPAISSIAVTNVTATAAAIHWITNEPADGQIEFLSLCPPVGCMTTAASMLVTSHTFNVTGLNASSSYTFRIWSKDAAGNPAVSANQVFSTAALPDTTAPSISSIAVTSITTTAASIRWSTDEPSDGQIEFLGPCPAAGCLTSLESLLTTLHTIDVSGLNASTTYPYRIRSRDAAGNSGVSAVLSFTTTAGSATILTAFWKFDEASGTSALDSSGNGLTGTLVNGPVRTAGRSGSALNFDGIDDYVDLGNPGALQLTGPMTLAAWVNTRSLARNGRIIAKSGGPGRWGWSLNVESYNAFEFSIAVDANTYLWLDSLSGVPLGVWVHVVGVYQPGAALHMYINGVLNSSRTTGIPAAQFNPPVNARIGSRADGFNGPCPNCRFDGRIDEVRVYNRALSSTEVFQLYSGS